MHCCSSEYSYETIGDLIQHPGQWMAYSEERQAANIVVLVGLQKTEEKLFLFRNSSSIEVERSTMHQFFPRSNGVLRKIRILCRMQTENAAAKAE